MHPTEFSLAPIAPAWECLPMFEYNFTYNPTLVGLYSSRTHSHRDGGNEVRARIILMVDRGKNSNTKVAQYVGMDNGEITRWTKRWVESKEENIEARLEDKPRTGRPATITAEQWCKIMALACEKPELHGVPITHWSHSTLRAEIIKQGIVESISATHVGNFLKKSNCNLIEVSTG